MLSIFSLSISKAEKPGVSAINEFLYGKNSTCLVVCFPLPKASDISLVSKFKLISNLFNKEDFPTPV